MGTSYLFYKNINDSGLTIAKFDAGDYSKIFNSVKTEDKEEIIKLLKDKKTNGVKESFFGLMNQIFVLKGHHHDLLIDIDEFNKNNLKTLDLKFNSIVYKLSLLLLIQLKDRLTS
jgi:hypothetical protein